jgi:Putative transmembrane protein (PGPGW)
VIPERRPRPLVVRVLIVVGGFALVALGALLLVLPGPGLLLIAAGLGMLSLEFRWAAALRVSVVRRMQRVTPQSRGYRMLGLAAIIGLAIGGTVIVALWGVPGFWPR